MSDLSKREKFLIEYYNKAWNNISRAEDAAWKMMAAYAGLIAGLSFVYDKIGVMGFLSILIIFSFFSISISMNANLWFVRNIGIISNIEKEFLEKTDYNYLIPRSYSKKFDFFNIHPRYWEAWWIHVFTYFLVCITLTLFLWSEVEIIKTQIFIIIGFYFLGILWTIYYGYLLYDRQRRFKENAKGKELKFE